MDHKFMHGSAFLFHGVAIAGLIVTSVLYPCGILPIAFQFLLCKNYVA